MPDSYRALILECWAGADSQAAEIYAREHLPAETSLQLGIQEFGLLAANIADQNLVDDWLRAHASKDAGPYIDFLNAIAPSLWNSLDADPEKQKQSQWARSRVVQALVEALKLGASLSVMDTIDNGRVLGFEHGRTTTYVPNPAKLFSRDDRLANDLANAAANLKLPAERFVAGLTTRSARGELFGLQVNLAGLALTGEAFGKIDASTIASRVFLVAVGGPNPIQASFQSKDGRWVTDRITAFGHFYGAEIKFSYDDVFIQRADMRGHRRLNWRY